MQQELTDLLKLNLEASFAICDNLDSACNKISEDFGKSLTEECKKIGLTCHYNISFKDKYNGIWISRKEWKYLNIGFQFQDYDKYMIYGFCAKKNPKGSPIPIELKSKIKALPNNTPKDNEWWPWSKKVEGPFDNWEKYQAWRGILDGKMQEYILERVEYLLKESMGIEM